jgi:hypothetical protein
MRHGLILMSGSVAGDVELGVRAELAGFDGVYSIEFFNRHGFVPLAATNARSHSIIFVSRRDGTTNPLAATPA